MLLRSVTYIAVKKSIVLSRYISIVRDSLNSGANKRVYLHLARKCVLYQVFMRPYVFRHFFLDLMFILVFLITTN